MSFQAQPQQQQQQQPVQVYPTSVTNQPPSHHSNGSFGTVFIVLAVIIVISAIACFLGRFCNRRHHAQSHGGHSQKPVKQQNQNHHFRPKEGDVELGFDNRIPTAKPNGPEPGPGLGFGGRGPKPPVNGGGGGDMKGFEMKNGDEGNLKAGA